MIKQQQKPKNSKHLVYGEWLTVTEACKKYGHKRSTIQNRMYSKKITLQEAMEYDPIPGANAVNKGTLEWQQLGRDDRLSVEDI